jgi:glutamate-1-semialdehyde 2,1-aminomutase
MTTLGKYLGGGMPFGAFGGRTDIMDQFDPRSNRSLAHSGTFNNNVFTMTAALAATEVVTSDGINEVNKLGSLLMAEMRTSFASVGLGHIVVTGYGSAMGIDFGSGNEGDMIRDMWYFLMLREGIHVGRRGSVYLNLAHVSGDIHQDRGAFLAALDVFCNKYRSL